MYVTVSWFLSPFFIITLGRKFAPFEFNANGFYGDGIFFLSLNSFRLFIQLPKSNGRRVELNNYKSCLR